MREPFTHDMRAVLSAPGKGLSLKMIFAASFFLLSGYVLYVILAYLALLYDGVSFDYIWQSYGFFPLRFFPFDSLPAYIIHRIGIIAAILSVSLAIQAVALITFEQIRGNQFFSAHKAIRNSLNRLTTLLGCFISLAGIIIYQLMLAN